MVRIDFPRMQHFYFWKLVLSHKYSNFSRQFLKYLLSEVKLFYLEATLRLRKYISYLKNEKRWMTSCQFLKYLLCEVKLFYLEATLRLRNEYFFLKNEKQWWMRMNDEAQWKGVEILRDFIFLGQRNLDEIWFWSFDPFVMLKTASKYQTLINQI